MRPGSIRAHKVGGMTALRALRGATTVDHDDAVAVKDRTQELLLEMLARNGIALDEIVSVLFTATDDIHSAFPAAEVREIGFGVIPLICAKELDIDGATPRCIRVLMHFNSDLAPAQMRHVYLHDAAGLRPDLTL